MSTHKYIDRICVAAIILSLLLTILFINGEAMGITAASRTMGYEDRLFDTSQVHTIDIIMDDWDSFIETCENEEYAVCSVVIDGEAFKNVGIRAKGNTSLTTVSSMDSDRYSFKIEFDQYDSTKSYHGLDKLSLNNLIQDNTLMKDYLTYQMMGEFGVTAPLCSYAYITVNGEDWGLYLAVEAIEESFLQRNYGSDYGELYKPDNMSFGGGRGNGRDFNIEDFMNSAQEDTDAAQEDASRSAMPEGGTPSQGGNRTQEGDRFQGGGMPGFDGQEGMPDGFDPSALPEGGMGEIPEGIDPSALFGGGGRGGSMGGGMGSSDVKLQYIDDDPNSYANIFDNAKTSITEADQARLIESLKALSAGERLEEVVVIEEVIRYFVVHNFVCNGDSYTGSMIHNYYLYEQDGQMAMLPWDYNLAFGAFQSSSATSTVNEPIDTPVSMGSTDDRPMVDWIFQSEAYTQLYHQYFAEFLESIDFAGLIDAAAQLIAPYVEQDPSKFCTYEEFETAVSTLKDFCLLRAESVKGQLAGTIPSTTSGQSADSSALIDASRITISDMGTMGMGGTGGFGGDRGDFGSRGDIPEAFGGASNAPEQPSGSPTPPVSSPPKEGIQTPSQGDSSSESGSAGTPPQPPEGIGIPPGSSGSMGGNAAPPGQGSGNP